MKSFSKLFTFSLLLLLFGFSFVSCGEDDGNEPKNPIQAKLMGKWYDGAQRIIFYEDYVSSKIIDEHTYKYTLNDNELTVEGYTALSGTITYIDDEKFTISRNKLRDWTFERKRPKSWEKIEEEENTPIPTYTNYIHYKYFGHNYYHEIKYAKQTVEFATAGTINGWNYKYLNFYIGSSSVKVGFQFESTYYEDEYPPTTRWPAMTYNITTTSGSAITHFPIARVFVYDNDMNRETIYPTIGKGQIEYSGNKMIFNFTSNEKVASYYVDIHFEGTLN